MIYRKLGTTDLEVSAVALGCWAFAGGSTWGDQDDKQSFRTVDAALDAGINFFDTAEAYGNGYSEEILGRALGGKRPNVVIASKPASGRPGRQALEEACEASLRRLQTDYIDLYQIHWPSRDVAFDETMAALEGLKQQGKVRAIGVCNFGALDLAAMLEAGPLVSNQLAYNLLWRAIEYEVVPRCLEHQVSILCYSPLAQGLLTGKFATADDVPEGRARTKHFAHTRPGARHGLAGCEEKTFQTLGFLREIASDYQLSMADLALGWLLRQDGVASVLAGARTTAQVLENAQACSKDLSEELVTLLTKHTEELKDALGPNPDMWSDRIR